MFAFQPWTQRLAYTLQAGREYVIAIRKLYEFDEGYGSSLTEGYFRLRVEASGKYIIRIIRMFICIMRMFMRTSMHM